MAERRQLVEVRKVIDKATGAERGATVFMARELGPDKLKPLEAKLKARSVEEGFVHGAGI